MDLYPHVRYRFARYQAKVSHSDHPVVSSLTRRLPERTIAALNLIRSQPSQYVHAAIAGRKYILAPRDILTVPHLKDVNVGDVIRLADIHELGSRDYTLRGNPLIPPNAVKIEATVVEHTKGCQEVCFKKKRRQGYQRTVRNKHPYTRLRIGIIDILSEKPSEEVIP